MSDTLTGTATETPDYPMDRDARCPFAPPPQVLEMGEAKPLSRVRIWDGSTPWLITGHEAARELFADSRVSVDDRRDGFPHWNEHMLSTVNKRPRSVFTSDAEEHTRFRRMLSKPFTFKRVEGLRSAIQEVTDECIDAILAGPQPADIVAKLALPVRDGEHAVLGVKAFGGLQYCLLRAAGPIGAHGPGDSHTPSQRRHAS